MSREWGHLCVKQWFFTEIKLVFNRKDEGQPLCPRPPAVPLSLRLSSVSRTVGPAPVPRFEVRQSLLGPPDPLGVALPEQPAALWGTVTL